jgi:hypothetical protein
MKYILFTCFVVVMCAMLWVWQIEGNAQNVAFERSKNAANRAAHDASLQIVKTSLADGLFVFDQIKATKVFKETLSKNMQLNANLEALPDTLFRGSVEIVHQDFVDDTNVLTRFGTPFDGSGKLYQFSNAQINLQQMIYGPSVIFIIKVRKPLQVNASANTYYYIGAIFEYPEFK